MTKEEYINGLIKYKDIRDAINELHHLEKITDKNYDIFSNSVNNSYVVVESMAWEMISRLGYQLVKWDIYDEIENDNNETTIVCRTRNYNGDYGKGSIFNDQTSIRVIKNNESDSALGILKFETKFCIDEKLGGNVLANIMNEIPMIIDKDKIEKFDLYINSIKENPDYKYNESHYMKNRFDPKRLNYVDIIIDGEEFEMLSSDELIMNVFMLFDIQKYAEIFNQNYNSLASRGENNNEI